MKKILSLFLAFQMLILGTPVYADLRVNPVWYDSNAVSLEPDWHYRVPIVIPNASINSTIKLNVDFAALLTQLKISGTFDINSPRVVRSNGTLSTIQEYNDIIFNNATDALNNNRGEIRFILQDAGPVTYYLYFDITQNGTKPVNPQQEINGNFERDTATGQTQPTGWNAPTVQAGYDAQVRPSENPNIGTDGAVVGNGAQPRVVDGTPLTGAFSYLLGARTNNEGSSQFPSVVFTKTITVPATNPGNLVFKYRIQGWDSNVNGNTTQYDYFNASIVGTATTNIVGPSSNNYTTYPFSPNYGNQQATTNNILGNGRSGYGQYNAFDINASGTRVPQGGNAAMTVARGAQPWWTVTQSLAAFAGQTVTLRFAMNNTVQYKTWAHIDDIEWSVINATLGTPQAFGVNIVSINNTNLGQTLSITFQTDASIVNPIGDLYDNNNNLVATGIRFYNNATHGDITANDAIWSNNGLTPADPTYTLPTNIIASPNWRLVIYGKDLSTSNINATANGLVGIPGQPDNLTQANFYNIDEQLFNVLGSTNITALKSVSILNDPLNGTVNPKAIPGATALYSITLFSNDVGSYDLNTLNIDDAIPTNTSLFVNDYAGAGTGPIQFINGATSSNLTYTYTSLASATDDISFSNNNGATYTYTPTPSGLGIDNNVTNIRISPKGMLATKTGTPTPSFTILFRVIIK